MLLSLSFLRFGLFGDATLEFESGFSAITGETGAGKSLLLLGLALVAGTRAKEGLVQAGAKNAEVIAHLSLDTQEARAWFEDAGYEFEGDIIIRRQINAQNRTKAWVNGNLVSQSQLKSLATHWLLLSTQDASKGILDAGFMRTWFDTLSGLKEEYAYFRAQKDAFARARRIHQDAYDNAELNAQRALYLKTKLQDLAPFAGKNPAQIEAEYDTLAKLEARLSQAACALECLGSEMGAESLIARALKIVDQNEGVAAFDKAKAALNLAQEALLDASSHLEDYQTQDPPNATQLEALNDLLAKAHRLQKKYQCDIRDLIDGEAADQAALDALENATDTDTLLQAMHKAQDAYLSAQEDLIAKRRARAPALLKTLTALVGELGLPNARFELKIGEDVFLVFAANAALPAMPIDKGASGGELARICLALYVMLAQSKQQLPLLVFDEIDVGVGGAIASVIGRLMRDVAKDGQLFAITHSAQVAAKADTHFLVATGRVKVLDYQGRIDELARMTSGERVTQTTLAHAKGLLEG